MTQRDDIQGDDPRDARYGDRPRDRDRDRDRDRGRDRDRDRDRDRGGSRVPCPKCGSRSLRSGPFPWYLGTVGTMLCRPVICNECDHEFDMKKPHADFDARKRNLALGINGVGALGILIVLSALGALIWATAMK